MAVTPQLLARLGCLDDLLELVAALGYDPGGDELNPDARARLGLVGAAFGVRRAAIVGRHGAFLLYAVVAAAPTRAQVAAAVERLARSTPGSHSLLLALD
ncbi:MAG TPA: hypothetical protein VEH83_09920, partial [Gemmatimonadales bacterium]|nr:hypothetical protein [Gemmatimonadales bacterium]